MADIGGFGEESFGDPMGGGGPIHVVRARAIGGRLVRVTFSGEPVHVSPSGRPDALNPANYLFSVFSGLATDPTAMAVEPAIAVGPTMNVASGEFAADVHTDRALVQGITYTVTVRTTLGAKGGGTIGSPYAANFEGAAILSETVLLPRKIGLADISNRPFDGTFIVGDDGDLTPQDGVENLRKRMLRRAATPKNSFAHLPGYGVGVRVKQLYSPPQLQAMKADLQAQLLLEPEVASADVSFKQQVVGPSAGVVTIVMSVKTKRGAIVAATLESSPSGTSIVVP